MSGTPLQRSATVEPAEVLAAAAKEEAVPDVETGAAMSGGTRNAAPTA